MSENQYLDEVPGAEGEHSQAGQKPGLTETNQGDEGKESQFLLLWERISGAGLGEIAFRLGTTILTIALILVVIWALRSFYLKAQKGSAVDYALKPANAALAAPLPSETPTDIPPDLPEFITGTVGYAGIPRLAFFHTNVPARPRTEIITYTVQSGDTIFGIAEKFNLKPETILWGNYYTLLDIPENLQVGVVLNILPVDGVYHKWSKGEGLNGVAKGYHVTPDVIVNWPGNHLDANAVGDFSHPNIDPGTWLVVPGGHRELVSWSAPRITRTNPAVAKIFGPGSCGTIMEGAVGTGTFVWPAGNHYLSGYNYSSIHKGIDVAGGMGAPIYAADSGVIVYEGWNNYGYGNVVVIDHGNGWQTLYAHQSQINVVCGQSVNKGDVIGLFGSTGNSSGPHLHFEMRSDAYGIVNPWDFLPPP